MKTIEEASSEYSGDNNNYTTLFTQQKKEAFKAGIEFAQRWIDVKDELPEDNMPILLKDRNGFIKEIGFLIGNAFFVFNKNSQNGYHEIYNTKVTHWRPIELK
ncbi:MAG: DUF551 domain-containing protein [Candidatus Azobacteroides sp.]|nr:DUF551 domain-containing protein [Candidatus Azobacteroides sp.]